MSGRERLRKNPQKTVRFITLGEALENINEFTDEVVILPPNAGDQNVASDEEDIDENDRGEPAGEIEIICDRDAVESDDEEISGPPIWRKTIDNMDRLPVEQLQPIEEKLPGLCLLSPYELWSNIFNNDMLKLILDQSNLYAKRDKGDQNFNLEKEKLLNFIGIIILSGYHCLPSETDYWSNQPDKQVPFVSNVMSRNCFQTIKKYIHLADNAHLEEHNKAAKVAPLYSKLNEALQQYGINHQDLSIDESMVPYFGRHSLKMFIKGKPIRFGYKLWVIAGTDGYPYRLDIYRGKMESTTPAKPLGSRVVDSLCSIIDDLSNPLCHHIYFDNFFCSHSLLTEMKKRNLKATGTIRSNRTANAQKVLISDIDLKGQERGSFDFRTDGTVYITKWNDSSIVYVGSNHDTHEPLHHARRRVKRDTLHVTQPYLIHKYNQGKLYFL